MTDKKQAFKFNRKRNQAYKPHVINQFANVKKSGPSPSSWPGVSFYREWLPALGFSYGTFVQVVPEPGGLVFSLCDENTKEEKIGSRIHVSFNNSSPKKPGLVVSGKTLLSAGLSIHDRLVVSCGHGIIKMRIIPETVCLDTVITVKDKFSGCFVPTIRLNGAWLADFGFTEGSLVSADVRADGVTFKLHEDSAENYPAIVKHARKNKLKLMTVIRQNGSPYIRMSGHYVDNSGFGFGDTFIIHREYGVIKLQKPNWCILGF